jgi:hypothetical protein
LKGSSGMGFIAAFSIGPSSAVGCTYSRNYHQIR